MKSRSITIYSFGIGTRGSVPEEYEDPDSGKVISGYYESEFNPKPLEDIAKIAGGQYFGIASTGELAAALSTVGSRETTVQSYHPRSQDTHYYDFLLVLATLCIVSGWIIRRIFLQEVC